MVKMEKHHPAEESVGEKQKENVDTSLPVEGERFYQDAEVYWGSLDPTIDCMLGGYAKISPTDINGSRAFLRPFLTVKPVTIWLTTNTHMPFPSYEIAGYELRENQN